MGKIIFYIVFSRDHPKALNTGFRWFFGNAAIELERKVKKGLTKTGQVW
jgi:hypothetical protein